MPAPTFVINSSITCYGVIADWQRQPKRVNSDGTVTWQNYALHMWQIEQMEISTFLLLQAQSGKALTSLATTAIGDRANGATYTAVEVGVVNCQQVGRRATNCHIEFRVDIS